MPTIDTGVDPSRFVDRHFREPSPDRLRRSEARRTRLEQWAQVVGHAVISLSLNPTEGETARVKFTENRPNIEIPSWKIPQPETDLQREAYDFLMQRTMTLHEVGHVNYTDQAALDAVMSNIDPHRKDQFHTIWNALEDGAIESQLRGDFSVSDEIEVMNANYMGTHGQSKSYGTMDATLRACLDLAVYDTGDLRMLLDQSESRLDFNKSPAKGIFENEILPELRSAIPEIIGEADPVKRTERIHNLWTEIEPYIDADDKPSLQDIDAKGDHATQENGSGSRADQLDSIDPADINDRVETVLGGDELDANGVSSDDCSEGSGFEDTDSADGNSNPACDENPVESAANGGTDENNDDTHGHRPNPRPDRESHQGSHNRGGSNTTDPDENIAEDVEESGVDSGSGESPNENSVGDGTNGAIHSPEDGAGKDDSTAGDGIQDPGLAPGEQESSSDSETLNVSPSSQIEDRDTSSPDSSNDLNPGSAAPSDEASTGSPDDTDGKSMDSNGIGSPGVQVSDIAADPDPEPVLENGYLERIADEQAGLRNDLEALEEEVNAFRRTLQRLENLDQCPTELEIPTDGEVRRDAWPNTRRQGTQLRQILEDQLRQEQRSDWRRRRPSGQVDTRSLPRIAQSDPRIFRQRVSPDEKDYSAALVLDRSGSMSNDIHYAEEATAALVYALEAIEIETGVLDMCNSRPRLAKPYGRQVESSLDSLLTGETGGSTPLSDAFRLARERVEQRDGTPICIVITDGQPDDQEAYLKELRSASFPVLGVYLAFGKVGPNNVNQSIQESARLFDQRKIVTDESRLTASLRRLCQEVMF